MKTSAKIKDKVSFIYDFHSELIQLFMNIRCFYYTQKSWEYFR